MPLRPWPKNTPWGPFPWGHFEDTGLFHIKDKDATVALLPMDVLHNGLPRMHLAAHWQGPKVQANPYPRPTPSPVPADPLAILKALLSSPNIASKEHWVRRYDHEVQGQTIVKPFYRGSYSSPSDGAVLSLKSHGAGEHSALALAHGINPFLSDLDPYLMAIACVDECVRGLLCSGASLSHMALLDNFCWPDPIPDPHNPEGRHRLGQLVRACEGLRDSCRALGLPLISGKDSMKNDYRGTSRSGNPLDFGVLPDPPSSRGWDGWTPET